MNFLLFIELSAVLTGLAFISLLIYEKIWCWPMGIISSLLSIYLFYATKLYAESILYFYYVLIGIYGWYVWSARKSKSLKVHTVSHWFHAIALFLGVSLSYLFGSFFMHYTDSPRPYADSISTIFSFIASYMEAQKILSSWIFWMCINAFSIWLYLDRGFKIYGGLMVVYFLLSVIGFLQWQKNLEDGQIKTVVV